MKILVLGGTRFFGIHMVKGLLDSGAEVTIATRGNVKDEFFCAFFCCFFIDLLHNKIYT